MKRIVIPAIVAAVGCCGYWAALAQQAEPEPPAQPPAAEKTYTLTESQLKAYVDRCIAQNALQESMSLHERILQGENWHRAVFNGMEYTVYTGPGQVLATRPVEPAPEGEPPATTPETPATTPETPATTPETPATTPGGP